ncbi:MAG: hypothetical protein K0B84_00650 [Firmicutes bacterium]|nr:hypothetical protein [Bacillota bacterium]
MLIKKWAGKNYFVALFILLGIAALLVISVFVLTAFIPDPLGLNPVDYEMTSVSEFEPWTFEANGLKVNFPDGGIIATLNETGNSRSYLLVGSGIYEPDSRIPDNEKPGGIFIMVEDFYFEEIRGTNIFIPVEDVNTMNMLSAFTEKQIGVPPVWSETIPLLFHAHEGLFHYYFITTEGNPILPPHTQYTLWQLYGTFIIYIIFILITLLLITIFSLDHRYSRYWFHLGKTPPGIFSLLLIPLSLLLIILFTILTKLMGWNEMYSSAGYAIVIVLLIVLAGKGRIDYLDLGLRRDRFKHGYFMAIFTSILIIAAVRGLPQGICTDNIYAFLHLPVIFIVFGLPRELVWRGFIQAVISRQLNPTKGLIVMIILAAIARTVVIAITAPWMLTYPYTYLELAVLVPGLAAILGYLYLRTENILACALLHSLILWLPGIILY